MRVLSAIVILGLVAARLRLRRRPGSRRSPPVLASRARKCRAGFIASPCREPISRSPSMGWRSSQPWPSGSWLAFKSMGNDVMVMGDLVLTADEVNPVLKRLEEGGVEITALHNHLLRASPATMYMHVHGHGRADQARDDPAGGPRSEQDAIRGGDRRHLGRSRDAGCDDRARPTKRSISTRTRSIRRSGARARSMAASIR